MAPIFSNDVVDDMGESSGEESSQSSSGESGARSPARSRSGSRSSARSGTPASRASRSRSASSNGSAAGSGAENRPDDKDGGGSSSGHSGAASPAKSRSRSRSRSGSRSSARSGSKSPASRHSRSRSRSRSKSKSKSRSRSPSGNESAVGSGDEQKSVKAKKERNSSSDRSGPSSPVRSRSRSGSRSTARSGSKSPASRLSRSRSRSQSGNESVHESGAEGEKKDDVKPPDSSQLFGDADDISDDDQESDGGSKKEEETEEKSDAEKEDKKSDEEDEARAGLDEEPMEVEEPLPETRIDVEIPKITTDLGKGIHFVKLPNFLSVETRPFDPNTYEDEIDEEETLDEEGRARLKLKVENTIRWRERFNEHNVFVKESNARFVRWSDGSLSLHLGSEIFNVHKQPLQGDHNHLFIRQGTGLQGQAVFRTKLTFRPHSTESFTHRKMTMSLADRSQKTSGIKVLSMVGHDPEAQRFQMIKKEEDKLRASVRRENKQRRVRERATSRGLTSSYLEPDRYDNDDFSDEDNTISLSAIKNRYKKNAKLHSNIYSSEDEDENDDDDGVRVGKKTDRPKRLKESDEESEINDGDNQGENISPVRKLEAANSGSNSD